VGCGCQDICELRNRSTRKEKGQHIPGALVGERRGGRSNGTRIGVRVKKGWKKLVSCVRTSTLHKYRKKLRGEGNDYINQKTVGKGRAKI